MIVPFMHRRLQVCHQFCLACGWLIAYRLLSRDSFTQVIPSEQPTIINLLASVGLESSVEGVDLLTIPPGEQLSLILYIS